MVERTVYSVECHGFKSHPRQLIFLWKSVCIYYAEGFELYLCPCYATVILPCLLQGMPGAKVKEEVNSMLEDLQLSDKSKITAGNLSGGMKRKLRFRFAG